MFRITLWQTDSRQEVGHEHGVRAYCCCHGQNIKNHGHGQNDKNSPPKIEQIDACMFRLGELIIIL